MDFINSMWMILYRAKHQNSPISPYSGLSYAYIQAKQEVRHYMHKRYMDYGYRGRGNKAWRKWAEIQYAKRYRYKWYRKQNRLDFKRIWNSTTQEMRTSVKIWANAPAYDTINKCYLINT